MSGLTRVRVLPYVVAAVLILGVCVAQQSRASATKTVRFLQIATGAYHSCAVSTKGRAYCWGADDLGELGTGPDTGESATTPTPVDTSGVLAGKTVTQISAGREFTCALADGRPYCWGNDQEGQLGHGFEVDETSNVPVAVDTSGVLAGRTLVSVSAGASSACAIDTLGQAFCWGEDGAGELGDNGAAQFRGVPIAVDTSGVLAGRQLVQVNAGLGAQACAVDSAGFGYCWGDYQPPGLIDTSGALAGKRLSYVSAGDGYNCALASGSAYCWGSAGSSGALGDGFVDHASPAPVRRLVGHTLIAIAASYAHTCAVDSTDAAYCWGDGTDGALGTGSTHKTWKAQPVLTTGVLAGRHLVEITGGSNASCALDTNGIGYCWGDNSAGQLGNGSTISSLVAVRVLAS